MSIARLLTRLPIAPRVGLVALTLFAVAGCSSAEDRAKSYYDDGMKLMAAHDNARAAVEFKNALKAKKDYIPAYLGLARIAELEHSWAAMIPLLRSVVELDPKDVTDRIKLARLLLLGGAFDEALNVVNAANDMDDRNPETIALKSVILFKLGDPKGAVAAAQAALQIDPKNSGAMSVLAADKLARGDSKGALQILDTATAEKDDLGLDLFKLKIFEQTQDLPQAEALLRRLAELYPKEPQFRSQLVRLYMFEHRGDDAIKEQRTIVASEPKNQAAELDLVRLLNTVKGAPEARQELISLISANGKDAFPYKLALAQFDFAHGDFDGSVKSLTTLISTGSSPEDVLSAQVKLAEMYLAKHQLDAAQKVVDDILRKDERNTNGLRLRAIIRLQRGEVEPAILDLRQALNDQPRAPDLMLLLASAYERSGSIELAEKEFADAMRASNFDAAVSMNYVAFLQRRGSTARAEDVLTQLSTRWPQNVQVLSALAQIKLQRQDWAGAQELAETIARISKNPGIADEIRGAALAGQNKIDESIAALQQGYQALPSSPQSLTALVNGYLRAKQVDKAIALLQNVLKANSSNVEAYVLLGAIELANKQPGAALQNFNTAIAKDPKYVPAYQALANYYLSQKRIDDAQTAIRAGLKEQPDSTLLQLMLAGTMESKGDFEGAIAEYEAMLKKDPGSLIVANNLASLLADHRTDKASLDRAQTLAAMLRKSPVPQFKDTLGWTTYQNGDYSAAVALLEEAAGAMPNQALVHYHLGMAYIATKQMDKATAQLKTALNGAPDAELKAKIEAALKKSGT
jgi:tetratricopeptide (TPR) repeat protein